MSTVKPISPLNLDRYELKYRIPFSLVEPISRYVEQFCTMDYYSQISPDNFYIINSLYLDTDSLFLFKKQERGELEYSSFRIRSYGANPQLPFYFESKQKIRGFCKKRRARVTIENFGDIIENPAAIQDLSIYKDKNISDFVEKTTSFGLRPVILTQYRRKAYLSSVDDYARVTFDRDMRYQEEYNWNVIPDENKMTHYDHPETFENFLSSENVVLELKCERKIPIWMVELIRMFNIRQDQFSKFRGSILDQRSKADEVLMFDRVYGGR